MTKRMTIIISVSLLCVSLSYAQHKTTHRPSSAEVAKGDGVKPGKEIINPADGSVLIEIPAGSFVMGSKDGEGDEKMVHTVYLDKYYIGKYEVTVGQFKKFCQAKGISMPEQPDWNTGDNYPVVKVTWYDAKAYCDWAGLRLPTEAEWEKAARGTDGRKYPWGNEAPDANGMYRMNSAGHGTEDTIEWKHDGYVYTAPVGSFPSGVSPYGCYDMAGNVYEWCNDWFIYGSYVGSPSSNPTGPGQSDADFRPSSGDLRVSRGGSWFFPSNYCRAFCRNGISAGKNSDNDGQGFRPAK